MTPKNQPQSTPVKNLKPAKSEYLKKESLKKTLLDLKYLIKDVEKNIQSMKDKLDYENN